MNDVQLQINNLWHLYGTASELIDCTLRSIDLHIKHGELLGLLGPSGCGKTTLLRLIAGFERPLKGEIFLDGRLIASPDHLVVPEKRGIGMVFQDYALFPHLNTWKNSCFGIKSKKDTARVEWLLELLGLAQYRHRFPHELSGGQRQRLALARALAPGTSLVLLDEPFSSLDVEVRQKLRSELRGVLKTCDASGLLVTHDPQEALAICDRVAVLKDGQLHQCSEPRQLVDRPATSFVGRFVLQQNILPIDISGASFISPIGPITDPTSIQAKFATQIMFDEQSVDLKYDLNGPAIIQGREFLGNHWILKVELGRHNLRVSLPLENSLSIGDRCSISFKAGERGMLFPGSIPCLLE